MSVRLEVCDGAALLRERADAWDALLARGGGGTFFLRTAWLQAWSRHFLAGRDFRFLIAERGGAWIGGLPLVRGRGRLGRWRVRKFEVAGAPLFDFCEVPAAGQDDRVATLRLILDWFHAEGRGASVLDLRELPGQGPTLAALRAAAAAERHPPLMRLCSRAPQVDLEAFARDGVQSSNLRSQLRRTDRRLHERGRIEVAFGPPPPDLISGLVSECAAIEEGSWKGRTGVGVLRDGAPRAWTEDLLRALAPGGLALLGTMRLDDRLIAYHLGFRDGDRFLSYNQAQVTDLQELGPGTLLQHRMLELGAGLGLRCLDASRGSLDRPHTLARYHGQVRDHVQALVYRRSIAGGGLRWLRHELLPRLRRRGPDPAPVDAAEPV